MVMITERWAKWLLGHVEGLPAEGMSQMRTGTGESAPEGENHTCTRVRRPGPLRARECRATPWEKHITHRRRQPRKALNVPLGSSAHLVWDARVDGMAVMTIRGGWAVPKAEGS